MEKNKLIQLLDEMAAGQQLKLYRAAVRLVPHLTADDLLQPNDFPQLENHPEFRYEEGVLEGILTVRMALLAHPDA